jgi:hypothetical protein
MSGRKVVDRSFLLNGSMTDGLLVVELRTSGNAVDI